MEEKEFSDLITQNQGIIWKICRSYTQQDSDAEDLFQEIVYQLWKSHKSFKGDSKFSTWMYRVALNTAITLYRKKSKSIQITDISEGLGNLEQDNSFQEKKEKIDLLYAAIQKLNDIERALMLLYLDDLPYKEISEALGITEVNARVKMNRAKKKLKEIMKS